MDFIVCKYHLLVLRLENIYHLMDKESYFMIVNDELLDHDQQ
jgi:hypothetical protein